MRPEHWLYTIPLRLRSLFRWAQGMTQEEAHRRARIDLGGIEQTKEECRDARRVNWIQDFVQDLRFAVRILRKSPAFTAVAVITLALGIGANTAIFSLIDAALLRSLPVRDPHQLVIFKWIAHKSPNTKGYYSYMPCPPTDTGKPTPRTSPSRDQAGEHGCSFSYPMFRQFQSLANTFSGVAALGGDIGLNLRGNGPVTIVRGELVSGKFFDTLGVGAAEGRTFGPSDDIVGAPAVAVLGYGYWHSAFGGDPRVIGRTIWLDNIPVTIVGVAAQRFPSLDPSRRRDIWVPISLEPRLGKNLNGTIGGEHPSVRANDDHWWVYIVARLKNGVRLGQAQAAADALFRNGVLSESKTLFKPVDDPRLALMPADQGLSALRDRFSKTLTILMSAVSIVLLIACANVAGLMLARSSARQQELTVRLALGAGRARIAKQLITESILLSLAGGTSGVLLAYWSVRSLVAFMSRGGLWPYHLAVHLDLRVLAFTSFVSLLCGVLFGLAPALRGTRVNVAPALKEGPIGFTGASSRQGPWNLGGTLVVAQVALSVLILSGAGLLVRTLQNLKSIDPGFNTQNVLLFALDPTLNGYTNAQIDNLYSQLQQRLEALPGVVSASYSFDPLLNGDIWSSTFSIQGEPPATHHMTDALQIGPKFFETLHIPLLAGRTLTAQDFTSAQGSTWCPAVINEAFSQQFLKNQNPLGHRISGLGDTYQNCEIVGVVGNARYQTLRDEIAPTVYVPQKEGGTTFEVRTAANPETIIPAVRIVVSQLDNNLPIFDVKAQSAQIQASLSQERLVARLSSFFAGLSLLLACIGLYGLLSYEVSRRTREIGVRMALGARPRDVLRFIVRQGITLSVAGTAFGILGALAATRYLASLLYGVRPDDPRTLAAVALLLGLVALAACYIPARRAMRVDPMVALRYE